MIIKKSVDSVKPVLPVFASNYRYPERPLEPPESKWKDVYIEDQTVNYTLDAVIKVYADGSWDYESVNSDETDWYSDVYDVFLCDDSDVLDYIYDLIGDNLNVPEGRYHIEGDVTLVFSVDGVRVQREYFEDEIHGVDYDESVSSDNAQVDFLSHLSHVDNLKLTKA